MRGVSISHATADKKYAEAFVDRIIKRGCGLQPDEILYSSRADTGVPSAPTEVDGGLGDASRTPVR